MRKSNINGFTLIELLIVIAIIFIMAQVAIPSYQGIRGRAKDASITMLLEEIGALEREYKADHGSFIECPLNPPHPGGDWQSKGAWEKLNFSPKQPLYGYQLKIVAAKDTFKAIAVKNSVNKYYVSHDSYEYKAGNE